MSDTLVEILLNSQALRFGEFETKAGRQSPYFINFGDVCGAGDFARLCEMFAQKITSSDLNAKILYGPAYKGIPLAAGVSLLLAKNNPDYQFAYNRKEAKDHGEGGNFVGAKMRSGDKVLIIEDVLTGGTSIRESHKMLQRIGVEIEGIVIALDREERGVGELSARQELEKSLGVPVIALQSMSGLLESIKLLPAQQQPTSKQWDFIHAYRAKWVSISS